jgi:asparagine synthase (glutamine-hydrolysing)
MCGIAGIVNARGALPDPGVLRRMCDRLAHRGPDEEGYFRAIGVGLGVRRLRVIDPEGGHQPISNERGSVWVVHNGEIYNYRELRRELEALGHRFATESDTEVIVHAYEQYGVESLARLRGMFAFALWDEERRQLLLARDRVGEKPLVYAHVGGELIFASELEALLEHPAISREIDWQAVHAYLALSYVPAPRTAFRAIRKLEPGHRLLWRAGEIAIAPYWTLTFSPKLSLSEEEAAAEWLARARQAVRLCLRSDVPVGAFLSGGLDSSAVVALMSEVHPDRVKTFTLGFDDAEYDEREHARRVARHLGTEHQELVLRPDGTDVLPTLVRRYGEPFADSSALPTYYLAKFARATVTVVLTGDGGDEGLAGYDRYRAMLWAERWPSAFWAVVGRAFAGSRRAALPPVGRRLSDRRLRERIERFLLAAPLPPPTRYARWMSACPADLRRELCSEAFLALTAEHSPERLVERHVEETRGTLLDALLRTDTLLYLPNDLLVKMDIATMAHGLEARAPLLDHELVQWQARLPDAYKLRRGRGKYLLRRALRGLLPPETLARRKQGFGVPLGRWLRRELRDLVRELLLSERALARGLFRPETVRALVHAHLDGRANVSTPLWTLLMLELWFREFIDRGAPGARVL